MQGSTSSGFKCEIDDSVLHEWDFIKAMVKLKNLEDTDSKEIDFVMISIEIENLIFPDKGKAFEKHIAETNGGKKPTDVVIKELYEIIQSNDQLKN